MKVFTLTDENMQTHSKARWVLGEWQKTSGKGRLRGDGFFHGYRDPNLAVLLNPIHVGSNKPRLFEAEAEGERLDDGFLRSGFSRMRLVKEVPLPVWTTTQKVAFGVLIAKEVCLDADFRKWADKWLDGTDRSRAWAAAAAVNTLNLTDIKKIIKQAKESR